MTEPEWEGLREAVADALEAPAAERAATLARACGSDTALLSAARELVALETRRQEFLRPPLPGAAGVALAEAAADAGIDARFGPYRATGVIAIGGMGTVYRAVRDDDAFERAVAVKVVNPSLVAPLGVARFDRERQALARLSHPNIAGLLDGGRTEGGVPYLVMELVEGTRIDEWCRAHDAAIRTRVDLMRLVAEGVHHAHRALVVHRDLKPSNILVTPDGTPKLLDFGISRLLDPVPTDEACPTLPGALTPRYAAPEQLRGEPATTSADVFAIGVVLYELLAGRPAWEDAQRDRPPPRRPSALNPAVPRDLDAVVLKALAPRPEDRYGSAEALADDLARVLDGRPVRARPPTLRYHVHTFVRRHRLGVGLGVAAATLIAAGAAAAAWFAVGLALERSRTLSAWASAERVTRLLAETLEAADAGAAAGESVRVETLLAGAAERVKSEADPAAAGAVHGTLARAYVNLGRHRDARPHADAAVERLTAAHGPDDARVATALLDRAALRMWAGEPDGALTDAREALRIRRAALPPDDPMVAAGHAALAMVKLRTGDTDGADAELIEARRLHAARADADAHALAEVLASMAELEKSRGRPDAAVARRREALEATRRATGEGSRADATAMVRLAEALAAAGALDEAEQLVARSTEIVRRLAGPEHPTVTYQMMTRAGLLEQRGRLAEAEQELREARRIAGASLPPDHYIPMFLALRHAQVLSRQDRDAEALAALEESYNACVTLLGPDHPNTRKVAGEGLTVAEKAAERAGPGATGPAAAAAIWRARAR